MLNRCDGVAISKDMPIPNIETNFLTRTFCLLSNRVFELFFVDDKVKVISIRKKKQAETFSLRSQPRNWQKKEINTEFMFFRYLFLKSNFLKNVSLVVHPVYFLLCLVSHMVDGICYLKKN